MLDIGPDMATRSVPRLAPWLPLLQRGPGELQVGIGAEAGLVLSGVPDGVEQVLQLADGRHTTTELHLQAIRREIEPALIDRILRLLQTAGLLIESDAGSSRLIDLDGLRVRLLGAGVLGSAVARTVLRAGAARLYLVDNDPVDPTTHPRAGLATTQAEALAVGLDDRVEVVDHWSKPEHSAPDLTLIATDLAEPDPAIGDDFVSTGHRHLYLRPTRGGAVVGPFVHPGRTPCLRCLDLTRRDADPRWPTLLPQLCRTRLPIDRVLADWAASTAITQVVSDHAGRLPSTLFGTLEMTADECEAKFRRWPMHPTCGCAG
ncbi:ThiF family adenylyltransferase [Microlunatus soli]|uniref:Bacteriocin biosynthesis cyclodehydratase domain-containing protein n=1 Tax=Microlunatus soli TaxID=630515 RepID=A0A1H1MNC0_9ACTN|nr:ThiF family adenylyltransferase [Microlunatus soli]SDR88284.1 bacteriocin biosynthesis cyclodehydratase domain-containing protein [Microlunatus soli]